MCKFVFSLHSAECLAWYPWISSIVKSSLCTLYFFHCVFFRRQCPGPLSDFTGTSQQLGGRWSLDLKWWRSDAQSRCIQPEVHSIIPEANGNDPLSSSDVKPLVINRRIPEAYTNNQFDAPGPVRGANPISSTPVENGKFGMTGAHRAMIR